MLIKKSGGPLFVSFTAFEDFLRCPRLYYWRRIRKLEKKQLYIPYFIGRVMGPGISQVFEDAKKAATRFKNEFNQQVKELRSAVALSAEEEKKIYEQKYIGQGMLEAYVQRYRKLIEKTKVIRHEKPFHYTGIKGVTVVGKIDNVFLTEKKYYAHELKTTSNLTPGYIKGIQTRLQPAMYYYMINETKDSGLKLNGIMFDVIQKPSIRLKQKETYPQYLRRLVRWYEDMSENKFYFERIHEPFVLTRDKVMSTIKSITDLLKMFGTEQRNYYQDFSQCAPDRGHICEMYDLCHGEGGEGNKSIMIQYKKRELYQVEKK